MVKVRKLEPPFIGSATDTGMLPAVAMSAALICAWSCVALMKVVARMLLFQNT